jgi:hypothetical protein
MSGNVDFSDPAVAPTFASLKDMKSPANWLAYGFQGIHPFRDYIWCHAVPLLM